MSSEAGNQEPAQDVKRKGKWDEVATTTVVRAKDELKKTGAKRKQTTEPVQEWSEAKIRAATPHQRSLLYRLIRIDEDGSGTVDEDEARNLEEEIKDITEGLNNYWTALGVVSALIMSITVPYCLEAPSRGDYASDEFTNDTLRWLNFLFLGLMFISSMCQFCAIATSVHLYIHLTILMVDPEDKLWFMVHNNIVIPQMFLISGLVLFLFAIPIGVLVAYSTAEGIMAACLLLCVFLYMFWFNNRYTYKSYAYLDRKIHKAAHQ